MNLDLNIFIRIVTFFYCAFITMKTSIFFQFGSLSMYTYAAKAFYYVLLISMIRIGVEMSLDQVLLPNKCEVVERNKRKGIKKGKKTEILDCIMNFVNC